MKIQELLDLDCDVKFTKTNGKLKCTIYNPLNSVIWSSENKAYYQALQLAVEKFIESHEYRELTKFIDMTVQQAIDFLLLDKNQLRDDNIDSAPTLISNDNRIYRGWEGARDIINESKMNRYKDKIRSFTLKENK